MPDAVIVAVAKAVTEELNNAAQGAFPAPFTAERSWADWDEVLKRLGDLKVEVVPAEPNNPRLTQATRSEWEYTVSINICVRQKLGQDAQDDETGRVDKERVDTLVLLVQRIAEYFAPALGQSGRRLEDLPEAVLEVPDGGAIVASYVREHLRNHRQFTGIVRLVYRVPRGPGE